MGDNVSTDEILPAGAKVLPYRSNIQKIEDFAFERIDSTYAERARAVRETTGHAVVAGRNYGQGSSRRHGIWDYASFWQKDLLVFIGRT